jgi:hypothetical protein
MPSVSKSQQRLFGAVHACQKTGNCASKEIKKLAKKISKKDAKDFAKTKHKGLPEKKKKKKTFKRWIENNHPEFDLTENLLGTIGNIGLGAAAALNAAVKRSKGDTYIDTSSLGDNENFQNKNYRYLNDFKKQNWNWIAIIQGEIISFFYHYPNGNEELGNDDFIPVNFLDKNRIKNLEEKNMKTKAVPDMEKGINFLKTSKDYWDDKKIDKFYEAIRRKNKKPEDFGGTDIRKQN